MNGFMAKNGGLKFNLLTLFITILTLSAMKKIFYCFILFLIVSKPVNAQVLEQDSLAIYDLFFTNDGGAPSGPLSSWPGITVTANRVSGISMGFEYSNNFPSSFSNLTALKKLTINPCLQMGCTWAGFSFPAALGNLDSLEAITVSGVSWSSNAETALLPLCSITSLKLISLSSTTSPFGFPLGGDIPAAISNLINLEKLDLSYNDFSSIPPAIFNCPKLEVVDFSNNFNMAGGIPESIGNCTTLKSLDLSGNALNGVIPASIGNCTELRLLKVTGSSAFGGIPNNLVGEIPGTITNCQKLTTFWVNGDWYGVNPFFENITSFPDLDSLIMNIGVNQTPNQIPDAMASLTRLSYLSLGGAGLSGTIPAALGNSPALKTLSINSGYISGSIPASIGNISTLQQLAITAANISGGIPASLGNLSQLQTLTIACANIGGTIPESFGNLSQLQTLKLSNCSLSGPIPASLLNLNSTVTINLSSNKFTFDGLEMLKAHFGARLSVIPQPNISIRYNNIRLSVNAGGTVTNNTYKWYRNGSVFRIVSGDSTLVTSTSGLYNVEVTNNIVAGLTLTSNYYNVPVTICLRQVMPHSPAGMPVLINGT